MYADEHVLTLTCDAENCLRPLPKRSQKIYAESLSHALGIAAKEGWTQLRKYNKSILCPQCSKAKSIAENGPDPLTVADRFPKIGDELIFGARVYRVVQILYEAGLRLECVQDGASVDVGHSNTGKLKYAVSPAAPQLAVSPEREGSEGVL